MSNNINVAIKEKKPTLSAQGTKFMVFGNWLIERLVASNQLAPESVAESRKILGMFSSVDHQILLYDGFSSELKVHTKSVKALVRQNGKPPAKAKVAKDDTEKKRGRKKKEEAVDQDPVLAMNDAIVAAANSDSPIVAAPEYVRAPKVVEDVKPKAPEEVKPVTEEVKPVTEEVKPVTEEVKPVTEEVKPKVVIDKAAKEAAKAAKEAAKSTEKAAKAAEKAAKEAAKAAEKAAKEAAKAAKKPVVLPIPVLERAPVADDEEEEEELECEVFCHDDVEYLIDATNCIYDRETQMPIGTYDAIEKVIKLNK